MTTFSLVNATPEDILVGINGGPALSVPRTGETSNWVPQQPEEVVEWSGHDNIPGQPGYGGCQIAVQRPSPAPGGGQVWTWPIPPLGTDVNINSLQLYIFSGKEGMPQALLLRDGFPLFQSAMFVQSSGMFAKSQG